MRLYRGNAPCTKSWMLIHRLIVDGEVWAIYRKRIATDPYWMNIKLAAVGSVPFKGNYWLGWNTHSREFALTRDVFVLEDNRPGLFEELQKFLDFEF